MDRDFPFVGVEIGKGDIRQFVVKAEESVPDKMFGAFQKHRLGGQIFSRYEKGRKVSLILKLADVTRIDSNLFGDEKKTMPRARRYYERWRFLRKIGIPTVGSMRIVDQDYIAMGDMMADGSQFFGKSKALQVGAEQKKGKRELTKLEHIFLGLDEERLYQELLRILAIADQNDVSLPWDDEFDLLVHPDGTFQILIMDLTLLEKLNSIDKKYTLSERATFLLRMVLNLKNELLAIQS